MYYVYVSTAYDYNDDGSDLVWHTRKLPVAILNAQDWDDAREQALDKAFCWDDDEHLTVRIEAVVRMS